MKIWQNTKTLEGFIDELIITDSKEEADIALLGSKPINIEEFPNLKGIFRAGVGRDNVPIMEAEARGVKVMFPSEKTVDYILEETADFTCYLILRMLYQHVGTLNPWVKFPRSAMQNRNLLLIGKGKIGSKVANKMKGFLNVVTYDVLINSEDELRGMIQKADCIALHIPNTPENKNFMDKEKLSLMKDGAVIINTARGAVVSEDALYDELKNERIYAAFDVYWKEPYEGKLKDLPSERFFMTPHVASTCNDFLAGAADDLRNLIKSLS